MRNHLYVAEFRGGAKGTTVYIPVLHEGGADAGSQGEKYPIVVALGPAEFVFTPGRGIGVVFEAHRNPHGKMLYKLSDLERLLRENYRTQTPPRPLHRITHKPQTP